MEIGSSKEHIFYFFKKNNLGYVDTSCLETFLNHCTVFTSLGKVRADFSSFCGLKY
jgi:hypothetical protein